MSRILFIGNTPLQIFISAWIKYHYFSDVEADIIIHDRLSNYLNIKKNIESLDLFDNVIVLPNQYKKTKIGKTVRILKEYIFARTRFSKGGYDKFFFANLDFFSERVYDFLKRKNQNLKVYYYEEGMGTYSKKIEYFFNLYKKPTKDNITHNNIFCKNYLFNDLNGLWLFNPDLLEWGFDKNKVFQIDRLDCNDNTFKQIVNTIFDYNEQNNEFTSKYIFFEESFYQDYNYNYDVDFINSLSELVGKENITVKIHPRNKTNRFKELGYKTNSNLTVPWEVIALNLDLSEKVLLTISSSSIVNPISMFNCEAKAFSVINCVDELPYTLKTEYGATVKNFFNYFDEISICESLNEIIE